MFYYKQFQQLGINFQNNPSKEEIAKAIKVFNEKRLQKDLNHCLYCGDICDDKYCDIDCAFGAYERNVEARATGN